MRPFYLLLFSLSLLALVACGTEEELIPPAFGTSSAIGSLGSTTVLSEPFQDPEITISGTIDDVGATLVANSTVTGEVAVPVSSSDGSWTFTFAPQEGGNVVSFLASDARGNINQLYLTVNHDSTPPQILSITQNLDDPADPKLILTFNEKIKGSSVEAEPFFLDGAPLNGAVLDTVLTNYIVTLPLSEALSPSKYYLSCSGIKDLSTPVGNIISDTYSFEFTIE